MGDARHHVDPFTPPHVQGLGHYYQITGFDEFVGLIPPGGGATARRRSYANLLDLGLPF